MTRFSHMLITCGNLPDRPERLDLRLLAWAAASCGGDRSAAARRKKACSGRVAHNSTRGARLASGLM